jgi:predicted O-methyltransferase YrrM
MNRELWTDVDVYFENLLRPRDSALEGALRGHRETGLPAHEVSPNQGELLRLLASMQRPHRILEVGTLGGYSAICLARALEPGGRLISFEIDSRRADIARAHVRAAGLQDMIDIRVGPADEGLERLHASGPEPFDFVFIDADKKNNSVYFRWALRMSRPGTVIVIDNVVRDGAILSESTENPCVLGVRRLAELIASEPRVRATALQTVGAKGWDGFILARVNDDAIF